jgi:hypothetical protein
MRSANLLSLFHFPLKGIHFLLLLFLWGLFACSQKKGDLNLIPQDSDFVVAVNMQSMALKSLSMKDLLSLDFLLKKKKPQGLALADRLPDSGIDFMGIAYCFGYLAPPVPEGAEEDSLPGAEVTYLLPIKDASRFEAFLKAEKGRLEGEKEGLQFFVGDSLIVGWNASTACITARANQSVDELKQQLIQVYNLPFKQSLAQNNDYFNQLKDKSYDMLFWLDASKAGNTRSILSGSGVLKDNYLGAVLNFEKGEVVFDGNFVSGNQAFGKYNDLMDKKVNQEFIKHVPALSPITTFALKLNLGTVKKMMQDSNSLATLNQYVQMLGMSSEEMLDMLSGDLVVAIVNAPDSGNTIPEMYVGLGIANQNTLIKLVSNFKNQGFLIDEGQYLSTSFMPELAFIPQEGKLVVANSPSLRESILSGKSTLNEDAVASLKEGAFSGYLDYDVVAASASGSGKDTQTQVISRYLRSIRMNAIQTSASTVDAHMIISLKDKDRNSLVSLTNMGTELKALHETDKIASPDSVRIP